MSKRICAFQKRILSVLCLLGALAESGTRQLFAEEPPESDNRTVFEYTGGFGKTWFVHEGGKKWVIYRGDGKTYLNVEESRTDEYITLRGPYTKLLYRLSADKFQMRGSVDKPWGRGIRGKWVSEENLPDYIRKAPKGYQIRLVYFVPIDREPVPNYKPKIQMIMTIVSELIHNDLRSKGYRPKRLQFESEDDQVAVHLVRGSEPAAFYNEGYQHNTVNHYTRIQSEITKSFSDPKRHLTIVFAETYGEGPTKEAWAGHIARGGTLNSAEGGLSIYSTWILKDAFTSTDRATQMRLFFDTTRIPGRKAFGSKLPNSPRHEFVEDGIGAVLHELGHALGLAHDHRNSAKYIMGGGGFREIRWNLDPRSPRNRRVGFSIENARMLMSSRYLASNLKLDDLDPPKVELELKRNGRAMVAQIHAEDESGLRAMVVLDRTTDVTTVLGGKPLNGESQDILYRIPAKVLSRGITPKIQVVVTDNGGNTKRVMKTFGE